MRFADSLGLALRKLRQRRVRAVVAVLSFAFALTTPVLVTTIYEGVKEAIVHDVASRSLSRRDAYVWRASERTLTEVDEAFLRGLPHLAAIEPALHLGELALDLEEGGIQVGIRAVSRPFLEEVLPASEPFSAFGDPVPVVLGHLTLLYRLDPASGRYERAEVDPPTWIGRTVELHVGNPLIALRRDPYTWRDGERVRMTEAELDLQARRRLAELGVEFDLQAYGLGTVREARVVGIFPGYGCWIPLAAGQELRSWLFERARAARKDLPLPREGTGGEAAYRLLFDTEEHAEEALDLLEAEGLEVRSYHARMRESFRKVRYIAYLLGGVVGVLLLLACFLVTSVIGRTILDARREIGILRALGARKGQIARIYLLEALLLSALGTLIGVALGNAAGYGLSQWVLRLAKADTATVRVLGETISVRERDLLLESLYHVAPEQLLFVAGALLLGLVAAWFPARKAARMDPVKALAPD